MISLAEAQETIARLARPLKPVSVPRNDALGRVLCESIVAREDAPAFDRSAMDGYALGGDGKGDRYRVVAEVQPGDMPGPILREGECARIFTGARIPEGTARVTMQEDVRREAAEIFITATSEESFIRRKGEDYRSGDELLAPGLRLRAGDLALLAQAGVLEVRASPRVRVAHIATGGELVEPEATPLPGQIRDTNSSLIRGLLARDGAELARQERVHDSLEALATAVSKNPENRWELLLISGGASVGDYDFGRRALESLGFEFHFGQVKLRPGKPLGFATRGEQLAFVIPGNPVSHFVVYHLAIRLALRVLEGGAFAPMQFLASLESELEAGGGRETWSPALARTVGGEWRVKPAPWNSSGDLRGLAGVNALVLSKSEAMPAGAKAECLLLEM